MMYITDEASMGRTTSEHAHHGHGDVSDFVQAPLTLQALHRGRRCRQPGASVSCTQGSADGKDT